MQSDGQQRVYAIDLSDEVMAESIVEMLRLGDDVILQPIVPSV